MRLLFRTRGNRLPAATAAPEFPYDILMPTAVLLSRFLMPSLPDPAAPAPPERSRDMTDLVMVALGAGGFALLGAYAALCARL